MSRRTHTRLRFITGVGAEKSTKVFRVFGLITAGLNVRVTVTGRGYLKASVTPLIPTTHTEAPQCCFPYCYLLLPPVYMRKQRDLWRSG
ncbi:hypothetical protein O3P69_013136 [Scylla paramamosain]|uniref:Uncharacterized protein n=1 Tax=Scylla paramamosain TaxID=85552 RepID=A0AAW0TYR0_SCYPA